MFTEFALCVLSLGDSLTSSCEDDVEIHAENTSVGIVLDSEINMLINTESEVTYLILILIFLFKFYNIKSGRNQILKTR